MDAGLYTVTVTDTLSSCVSTASIPLVSSGAFTYTKEITSPDCKVNNGSLKIIGQGNFILTGDTIKSTFTTNLGPKIYRFSIVQGNCGKYDSVIITAKAPFKVTASLVQPTCTSSGSINLSTDVNSFTVSGMLKSANNNNLGAGTYAVRLTDPAQCYKDTSFTLVNADAFQVKLKTRDTSLCNVKGANVKPAFLLPIDSTLYTFLWNKKGIQVSSKSSLTFSDSGRYVVTVKNAKGCTVKDSLILRFNTAPFVYAGKDTSVCQNNAVLNANALKSDETGSWTRIGSSIIANPLSSRTTVTNLSPYDSTKGKEANSFIWTVRKGSGVNACSLSDTVKVYYAVVAYSLRDIAVVDAGDSIDVEILKNDKFSLGQKFKITRSSYGLTSPIDSAYIIGDSIVRFKTKPTVLVRDSISYTISNSCLLASSTARIIVVPRNRRPNPIQKSFTLIPGTLNSYRIELSELDRNENVSPSTITFVSSESGITPTWAYTSDKKAIVFTMNYPANATGKDKIRFRLCDEVSVLDCSDIIFENNLLSAITVYNAVSPNGDGKNDFLQIDGITGDNRIFVQVFNRWGDKVYSETDYDNLTRKFTGDNLPDGTYYYILEQSNGDERKEGFIILKK